MKCGMIWTAKGIKPWHQVVTPPFSFTTMYGYGVFEGIRTYNTINGRSSFRMHDHIDRLLASASLLNIPLTFDKEYILSAIESLLREMTDNKIYIRPMIMVDSHGFLGIKAPKLTSELIVAAIPWKYTPSVEKQIQGLKVQISAIRKSPPGCALLKAKATGNYLNSIIALNQINDPTVDDLIFCDHNGFIAEASGANLFCIKDRTLISPSSSATLDGITQDTVLKIAKRLDLNIESRLITSETLYESDELFFTGTASEIIAVTEVDNHQIGTGLQGEITTTIYNAYSDVVRGKKMMAESWLLKI